MNSAENNENDLRRMEKIVSGNWKATLLLRSLWNFFEEQIHCNIIDDDGRPNQHSIQGITAPNEIGELRIALTLRHNNRSEEGLVHELLHSNMIPLGYPLFWLDEQSTAKWNLGRDILNSAEHHAMLPLFLQLGYSEDRFLGPSEPLCLEGLQIMADLEQMKARLASPKGFMREMSQYLSHHGVKWKEIPGVADVVFKRRQF